MQFHINQHDFIIPCTFFTFDSCKRNWHLVQEIKYGFGGKIEYAPV